MRRNIRPTSLADLYPIGLDAHSDTPVEVLHTILLRFVKYFWRDVVQNQVKAGLTRSLLEIRLSSVDVAALGFSKIPGKTLVNYAGSLNGRVFQVIAQVALFVLVGMVSDVSYKAWISLSHLVSLVWQSVIPDIDEYLVTFSAHQT